MRLAALLPRPLDTESGTECATLLGSLLTAAHLDRNRARGLGWRGVRPSGTAQPAWTCRVAGSAHVFGLIFNGERLRGKLLDGEFAVFVFPSPEDPILDAFPLAALGLALDEGYEERIRGLSAHAEELAPFQLGTLRLSVRIDGTGLSLHLTAPARQRIVALDGIPVPDAGDGGSVPGPHAAEWLIRPGGLECDLPAFRMLLPLFSVLTATLEQHFAETATLFLSTRPRPPSGFDASGKIRPLSGKDGWELNLTARAGEAAGTEEPDKAPGGPRGRVLSRLPLRRASPAAANDARPVLHVLTGFLGAGKTTFLKRWLDFLHGRERYTGVIQNEFGQIGLDAALLREDTGVEALDDGCVCCSLADSLRPGLLRLMANMPAGQFILETTGLANPANVLAALDELRDVVRPGLVITVVDALDLCRPDNADPETEGVRREQLEWADALIVTKADTVSPEALDTLITRLRHINGRALLLPARHGHAAFAELDARYLAQLDREERPPSRRPALQRPVTHREEGYAGLTLRLDTPVTPDQIRSLLRKAGPGLRRAKGIVNLRGSGPAVAQYAAGRLDFEPVPAKASPETFEKDETQGYLVLIGKNLQEPGTAGQSRGDVQWS